ncbi:MAG TPA: molybdenum cofactor guanylyltransferase [Pirellulales bacterium]|nr:molybdenum cofactor guanylyltransferase [Pirellulales bacterium]
MSESPIRCGGIVLCGGKSSRMGMPKAMLPFGPEILLQRVVRLLAESVAPVVVVAAADQVLPDLPDDVLIARDHDEFRGPLAGIAGGLVALGQCVDAAFATGCDVPFLSPAFVRRLIDRLGDADVAVPRALGFHHPLAAVYRTSVRPHVEALLAADRLRAAFLFERVRTRELKADELLDVDPGLRSLANLNDPADYRAALTEAGFAAPGESLYGGGVA